MVETSKVLQSVSYIVNGNDLNMPEARNSLTQLNIASQQKENAEAMKRDEIEGGSE